ANKTLENNSDTGIDTDTHEIDTGIDTDIHDGTESQSSSIDVPKETPCETPSTAVKAKLKQRRRTFVQPNSTIKQQSRSVYDLPDHVPESSDLRSVDYLNLQTPQPYLSPRGDHNSQTPVRDSPTHHSSDCCFRNIKPIPQF
ncbi:unnamed protein product, partial [Meganyctiphanes norvegica]